MITEERKGVLMADLEYSVNRYLDKQWVISDAINNLTGDDEELTFLHSLSCYFAVMLPEEDMI